MRRAEYIDRDRRSVRPLSEAEVLVQFCWLDTYDELTVHADPRGGYIRARKPTAHIRHSRYLTADFQQSSNCDDAMVWGGVRSFIEVVRDALRLYARRMAR